MWETRASLFWRRVGLSKVRGETFRDKAIYVAKGVIMSGLKEVLGSVDSLDGRREVLALYNDGAGKQGIGDIYIACVDGLKGFRSKLCLQTRTCSCA